MMIDIERDSTCCANLKSIYPHQNFFKQKREKFLIEKWMLQFEQLVRLGGARQNLSPALGDEQHVFDTDPTNLR
jgi:hypothetical protein